jgi:hypothetical protein
MRGRETNPTPKSPKEATVSKKSQERRRQLQARSNERKDGQTAQRFQAWDVVKGDRPDWNHNSGERRHLVVKVEGETLTLLPFSTTSRNGLELWLSANDGRDQDGRLQLNEGWTTTGNKVAKVGRLDADQQAWVADSL